MGKHRKVRRLGALLAAPVAIFGVSVALLVSTIPASATVGEPEDGTQSCSGDGATRTIQWTVSDDQAGTLTVSTSTSGASLNTTGGPITPGTPFAVTMTLPGSFKDTADLTATVNYDTDPPSSSGPITGHATVAAPCPGPSPDPSPSTSPSPSPAPTAPPAPGTPTASNITISSVRLTWTGSTGATGYRIERAPGASGGTFTQIATTNASTLTYTNTGLSPSTTYRYRVRASGANGTLSAYSGVRPVTTAAEQGAPPPPQLSPEPPIIIATFSSSPADPEASRSSLPVLGNNIGGSSSGADRPSLVMVGGTAGILFAFLIALVLLVRERRLLRLESEDEDDDTGYWTDYHTQLR